MSPKGKFLAAGEVIGGSFVIEELIGHGGMGCVYRARDKNQNPVALKMLLRREDTASDWEESAKRLRDEARAMAAVDNPALVSVLSWGEDKNHGPFVVLEFLLGDSLRQRLDSSAGKMSWSEVIEKVARPMLQALAALHGAGIVHRDVKPENLFDSGDGTYKLGDLGLASFAGREAHTKTGSLVGTPKYLAPERLCTTNEDTAAVDVYGAAMVIVETMAGSHPFKENSIGDLVKAQVDKKISRQFIAGHGVPALAARVLEGALSKKPNERPSAADLLQQLTAPRKAQRSSERTSAVSAGAVKSGLQSSRQGRPQLAMVLIFLCSLFLALGYWWSKKESSSLASSLALMSSVAAADFNSANSDEIMRLCYSFDEIVQEASRKGLKATELVRRAIEKSPREGQLCPLLHLLVDKRYGRFQKVRDKGRKLLTAYQRILKKNEKSEGPLLIETLLLEQLACVARQEQEMEAALEVAANRLEKLVHNHRMTYVKQRLRILFIRATALAAAARHLKANVNRKHKHAARAFTDLQLALEVAAFHPYFAALEADHWQKLVGLWAKESGRTISNLSYEKRVENLVLAAEAASERIKKGLDKLKRFVLYEKNLVEAALLGKNTQGKKPTIDSKEVENCVSAFRQAYWCSVVAAFTPKTPLRALEILAENGPRLHLNHISAGDIELPMREYGWGAGIERGQSWSLTCEIISGAFSSLYREGKSELSLAQSGPLIHAFLFFLYHTRDPSAASIGKIVRRKTRFQLASYPLPEPNYSVLMSSIHLGDKQKDKCLKSIFKVLKTLKNLKPKSAAEWRWLSMYHLFAFDFLARMREGQKALSYHKHVRDLAKICEAQGATKTEAIHLEVIGLLYEANVTIRKVTKNDQDDSHWRLLSDEERMERLRAINPEYPKLIKRLKELRPEFEDYIDELSSEHRTVVAGRPVADVEI